MKSARILGLALILISNSAWSQDNSKVDWRITPYLWMVNMEGSMSVGPIDQDVDMSFSDIVKDLDFAGEVFAEVGKDKHAVHVDYTYLRLKPDPTELPNPPFQEGAELSSKLTANLFEAAYKYRWNGPNSHALVLGARLIDIEMRMTAGDLPAVTAGPSWWDYFVGIQTRNQMSPKWDFGFYGTVGTGGSDLPWTAQATFGRRYSNDNRLMLGLRAWGIDYSKDGGRNASTLDMTFYGLMVGYEFN